MTQLSASDICARIAVQPPYFAFTRLDAMPDSTVYGEFTPEQPLEYEKGPITAAEIGRHLAILGSCAAAVLSDDLNVYYLATNASYRRLRSTEPTSCRRPLKARARIAQQSRRTLVAEATVSDETPFAELTTHYQIMPGLVFDRVFAEHRVPSVQPPLYQSPYATLLPLTFDTPIGLSLLAHSAPLHPSACSGHFPDFPAWPVALIMHSLERTAGRLLHHLAAREIAYTVTQADLSADRVAFAHQPLTFHVSLNCDAAHTGQCIATCEALEKGISVARVIARLQKEDVTMEG